jgi:hypothetical protein
LVVPLAQELLDEEVDAPTVVLPAARSVANPGLVVENVSNEALPELHVAELVTLLPLLSVAEN